MKKNTVIALIALWLGVAACAAFVIWGTLETMSECSREIEDIIDAVAELLKEAWPYAIIVLPVAFVGNKLRHMAVNLYKNSTKEEP